MSLKPGTVLGVFEVLGTLGAGGMGEVYRARDSRLGREVAIKVLPEAVANDPARLTRFEREARALAAVDHPNVAAIHGLEDAGGIRFLVMQLVEGRTLDECLKDGRLQVAEALSIFSQLAEGLASAHERGIIHRDLKPPNIKITAEGRARLLDFGLAKASLESPEENRTLALDGTESQTTQPNQILGTPAYMSPEQTRAEKVDHRADVWGFGCCLYEALTGVRPFQGKSRADLFAAILNADPDWAKLPDDLPASVRDLIRRCLRKKAADRPGSIEDVRAVLIEALEGRSGSSGDAAGHLSATGSIDVSSLQGFKTVVSSQIAGGAELRQRLGVATADAITRQVEEVFDACARDHAIHTLERSREGMLCAFDLPSDAVECATEFQRRIGELDLPEQMGVRIGISAGEISASDSEDRDGEAPREIPVVDMALRLMGLAEPGQILLTGGVFDLARQGLSAKSGDAPLVWLAHGPYHFTGVAESVDVFEVGIRDISPLKPPADTSLARSAAGLSEADTLGWRPAVGLSIPRRPNWTLRKRVGEGGYGEVWLAEHDKTQVQRIFKFCFEAERIRGLKREVVLFRLLSETLGDREDIAKIHDWEFDSPPYFLEAEYTAGGDLASWLEAKGGATAVPLEVRLEIVAQVATALEAAHEVGVLHKDIKPANILITERSGTDEPRAALTDFGIGLVTDKRVLEDKGITIGGLTGSIEASGSSSESAAGTRLYMAPELQEGRPATTRSDIYALGIVLYQLVMGDLKKTLAPGWERDIGDTLLREDIAACIDGNPERRLPSAMELATRLRTLGQRAEERESVARRAEMAQLHQRRRRQFISASVVGAALTLILAYIALREFGIRREAEYAQYVSNVQAAALRTELDATILARRILENAPARHRNWEWAYLAGRAWRQYAPSELVSRPENLTARSSREFWNRGPTALIQEIVPPLRTGGILEGEFVPDGKHVMLTLPDGPAGMFSIETGELVRKFGVEDSLMADATADPDGGRLITSALAGNLTLWDLREGTLLRTSGAYPVTTSAMSWSPDGKHFVSAHFDSVVLIWNPETMQPVAELTGHSLNVTDFHFPENGAEFWTVAEDGEIRQWSLPSGELLAIRRAPFQGRILFHSVSPDGKLAVVALRDGSSFLWDVENEERGIQLNRANAAARAQSSGPNRRRAAHFSTDAKSVAVLTSIRGATIYDVESGEVINRITGHASPVRGIQFSPHGAELLTTAEDGTCRIWTAVPRPEDSGPTLAEAHDDAILEIDINAQGTRLLTGSYDTTVRFWNLESGALISAYGGHQHEVLAVHLHPDGSSAASIDAHGHLHVWDTQSGEPIFSVDPGSTEFSGHISASGGGLYGEVLSFPAVLSTGIFTPDGTRLVAFEEDSMKVFDATDGTVRVQLEGATASGWPVYSFDSKYVAVLEMNGKEAGVWELATGKPIARLVGHKRALVMLDFSPVDYRIVSGGMDAKTLIWEGTTGEILHTLEDDSGFLASSRFSDDGRWVLTGTGDSLARVWDVETGELVTSLTGHSGRLRDARVSPDRSRVVTWALDDVAIIWDLQRPQANPLISVGGEGRLLQAHWSPDGRQIISAWSNGTVSVWSGATVEDLEAFATEDGREFEDRFSDWQDRYMTTPDTTSVP